MYLDRERRTMAKLDPAVFNTVPPPDHRLYDTHLGRVNGLVKLWEFIVRQYVVGDDESSFRIHFVELLWWCHMALRTSW